MSDEEKKAMMQKTQQSGGTPSFKNSSASQTPQNSIQKQIPSANQNNNSVDISNIESQIETIKSLKSQKEAQITDMEDKVGKITDFLKKQNI